MIAAAPSPAETIEGYVFGPFRLDIGRRILYSGSSPTPIPERLFQMLLMLIQSGGKAISREVLAHEVWGDTGVTDTNLNQHVYLLRLLLHEHKSERKYIVTVPREGYRFAVAASPLTTRARADLAEEDIQHAQSFLDAGSEAFQLYCRGSFLLNRQTVASIEFAVEAFTAVLRADPDYVPALVALARAHALLGQSGKLPPRPCFQRARAYVERALRIDPRSSSAHAVLSELSLFADWNWPRAGRSAQTSLALNPQSVTARSSAAWYYVCRGDAERALHEVAQALLVDPGTLWLQLLQARILLHSADFDKAISAISNILLTDPDYHAARRPRAEALLLNAQFGDALEDLQSPADGGEGGWRLALLARAHAGLGSRRRAKESYEQLCERRKQAYVASWDLAIAAEAAASSDEAVHHLQDALSEREPNMLFLRTLPWFRSLERRSEYKRLIRRTQAPPNQFA